MSEHSKLGRLTNRLIQHKASSHTAAPIIRQFSSVDLQSCSRYQQWCRFGVFFLRLSTLSKSVAGMRPAIQPASQPLSSDPSCTHHNTSCSISNHPNLIHTLTHYLMRNYYIYLHGRVAKINEQQITSPGHHLTYCETFYCQQLCDKIYSDAEEPNL